MEKDDLSDLEEKIDELKEKVESIRWELSNNSHVDELKREVEFIHSELSDINRGLSDVIRALSQIEKLKFTELLIKIDASNDIQERTNEILGGIESGTDFIKIFGWVVIMLGIIGILKGCFG